MLEVLCLEGNWRGDDLGARDSLRPLLDLLASHEEIEYAYRDVATLAELEHYAKVWADYPDRQYEFAYLAFHGDKGKALLLDRDALTLEDLGKLIRRCGAGEGKIIHIASCYGLRVSPSELKKFLKLTSAIAVCGYEKDVLTLEAAAFELLLLSALAGPWRNYRARFEHITEQYPDLTDHLGFIWAPSD